MLDLIPDFLLLRARMLSEQQPTFLFGPSPIIAWPGPSQKLATLLLMPKMMLKRALANAY